MQMSMRKGDVQMSGESWDGISVHPDFALLEKTQGQAICCLLFENLADEDLEALSALVVLHVYRHAEITALLLAVPEETNFLGELEEKLAQQGLCAGLSGPFALAASAHGCMRKAQIALQTGRRLAPGRALYPMDEFGEAALLYAAGETFAREGFEASDFYDASIDEMRCVDEATGTQYARSLYAYLMHGLDLRLAAQAMGVHRNTLDYRMKRVQELFSIDLEDVNTCFELLFSFWLSGNLAKENKAQTQNALFDAEAMEEALFACLQRRADPCELSCGGFACRMMCIGVSGIADEDRIKLLKLLRSLVPRENACAFDDDVILFVLSPDEFDIFDKKAAPLCRQKGCGVVTTQVFDASRIMYRVRICKMALHAVGSQHMRTQDMASTLAFMTLEKYFSLSPYYCEDVIRVMDEDAQRRTALSRSLYAYLLNFRDMKRAAQQLGLHRNTMEYHMRKIDTLIGKPSEEKRRFLMMCTYKMLALPESCEM